MRRYFDTPASFASRLDPAVSEKKAGNRVSVPSLQESGATKSL